MKSRIGVGVVGAGLLGEVHARTYRECGDAKLEVICDVDVARARRLAEKYRCRHTGDLRVIAADRSVRAVSVATPDFDHYRPVMAMLEAGKDVLCEKPLAMDAAEAQAMVRKARSLKRRLMVDFQNRWNPLFLQAKKEMAGGRFGRLVAGYARLSNTLHVPLKMLSWAGRSGPQWFLLPHLVDLVDWLLEAEPLEVYGSGRRGVLRDRGLDTYDAVQAMARFEDGCVVFESSWVLPESYPSLVDFRVDLLGTLSRISIRGDYQGVAVAGKRFTYPFVLAEQNAFGRSTGFFREPILHFVDAIAGGRPTEAPGADGLVVTRVVAAIEKSIAVGRPVRLSEMRAGKVEE